jgi:hypothetical protein
MRARIGAAALVAAGTIAMVAGPVGAAPTNAKNAVPVLVDCGSGNKFTVASIGNGKITVGHVIGSNELFVPISFGEFRGTFTPAGGGTPVTTIEPAVAKHTAPPNGKLVVSCTYTLTMTDASGTFTGTGSVVAFLANG